MTNAIREIRKARKLTLKDVAAKLNVSEGQASRIEREGTDSLTRASAYAELLNVPVEMFRRKRTAA